MSSTPVVGSVEVKVRVASHLSKVPFMATDAFTANLTELSSVENLKTGTWALLTDGSARDATKQRTANRMVLLVSLLDTNFLLVGCQKATKWNQNRDWAIAVLGHRALVGNWQNQ